MIARSGSAQHGQYLGPTNSSNRATAGPTLARAPLPDRAEWNPDDQGDLAIEQSLNREGARLIDGCLRMHENSIARTTDIFVSSR
jgi:hypothetical protein